MSSHGGSKHSCAEMARHLGEGDVAIRYSDRFREYGIRILDGGTAIQVIHHCPWCGARLPGSLRDQWFDMLEQLGLEPGDPQIPEEMLSAAWWHRRGL